jgi:murein DD-endopeptidase MepM/ murein hydrolase activator NlpD
MRQYLRYILVLFALFIGTCAYSQINKWQDLYKVKKKDTIFGIAKKYGLTIPDLMNANPEMKEAGYELKKGDTLFIPYISKAVVPASVSKKGQTPVKMDVKFRTVKVGIMLPLHNVDRDGKRMVEYYRGFLLACEDMKAEGLSIDVHAWNVPIDADIRQTLLQQGAKDCDVIFGPLYTPQVKALGDFCKTYDIKMVIPFSITGDEVGSNAHIYQVYQSASNLNNEAIKAYFERFPNHHPVFVDCNDTVSKKGVFTFGLRNQLEQKGIKYSITNLKSSEQMFSKAFSRTQPNVVILNSGRSPALNVAFAKLSSLLISYPQIKVSLFGYTEWLMFTKNNLDNFNKFDTYIPTTFYYNPLSPRVKQLEERYRKAFHQDMQYALPRFAITGYDQAQFFLQGLHKYGKNFSGARDLTVSTPVQTSYNFVKEGEGGYQNSNFELIHYKTDNSIESITY